MEDQEAIERSNTKYRSVDQEEISDYSSERKQEKMGYSAANRQVVNRSEEKPSGRNRSMGNRSSRNRSLRNRPVARPSLQPEARAALDMVYKEFVHGH